MYYIVVISKRSDFNWGGQDGRAVLRAMIARSVLSRPGDRRFESTSRKAERNGGAEDNGRVRRALPTHRLTTFADDSARFE